MRLSAARTPPARLVALSLLIFLDHSILGAWFPILPVHMESLGYSAEQIALLFAVITFPGMLAPWIGGFVADRLLSPERTVGFAQAGGAVLLWLAASQTEFAKIATLLFFASLIHLPTLAITNAIIFHHLEQPEREFGGVRLWGTSSWVVLGAVVGLWLTPGGPGSGRTADALRIAAVLSAALSVYCLFLPATPPHPATRRMDFFGPLALLRIRSVAVIVMVLFVLSLTNPFVYPLASMYLKSRGAPDAAVSPLLALGQVGEVLAFLALARVHAALGTRKTILLGLAAWCVRFGIWAAGGPWALIGGSILLHGLCYAFVYGLGQVHINCNAPADQRAGAQAVFQILAMGIPVWLGNFLAKWTCTVFQITSAAGSAETDFTRVYLLALVVAALCLVSFAILFRATPDPDPTATSHAR